MKMSCNLKIIFASLVRVKSYLRCYFQDLFTKVSVVATMPTIMITKRDFKVQICKHLGILHLTGKKEKICKNKLPTIQLHLLSCNYSLSSEYFSILITENDDLKLEILKNLPITHNKPLKA